MPVGADKVVVYAGAKHAHGRCLQPAALRRWRDDGDVGPCLPLERRGQRLSDGARSEILVLGEDRSLGGGDGIEVKIAHLEHARAVLEARLGASDRYIHVGEVAAG